MILIASVIIIIFLSSFLYFSKFNFPNMNSNPVNNATTNSNEGAYVPPENPDEKTLSIAYSSCSVSSGNDIVKFKISSTGIKINHGEISAFLDDNEADFRDSDNNKMDTLSLMPDSTSPEFSYTASGHKSNRKITVASPAGAIDQTVTCS